MSNETLAADKQTETIRIALGDNITWRYEERFDVMLSEFAQNKGAPIFSKLQTLFPDEWDVKNIKYAPPELIQALGSFGKLTNNQQLFTIPATTENPTIIAMWWPWGHGGTYSLRLKIMETSYDMRNKKLPLSSKIKAFFNR